MHDTRHYPETMIQAWKKTVGLSLLLRWIIIAPYAVLVICICYWTLSYHHASEQQCSGFLDESILKGEYAFWQNADSAHWAHQDIPVCSRSSLYKFAVAQISFSGILKHIGSSELPNTCSRLKFFMQSIDISIGSVYITLIKCINHVWMFELISIATDGHTLVL